MPSSMSVNAVHAGSSPFRRHHNVLINAPDFVHIRTYAGMYVHICMIVCAALGQ